MEIILISVTFSAATTFMITAVIGKKIVNYVEEICNVNIEQVEKIKECAITNIETLIRLINQNKSE